MNHAVDAARLLAWASGFSPNQLSRVLKNAGANDGWGIRFVDALGRFERGESIEEIVAQIEFRGRPFRTDARACLIRQYGTVFVDEVLSFAQSVERPEVLEVGCGAGHLIVSLALELGPGSYSGIDVSGAAIELARENAKANNADVSFLVSDLFDGVEGKKFDAILANLPLEHVASDSGSDSSGGEDFEPHFAIFDSSRERYGLLKRFMDSCIYFLNPGGQVFVELSDKILESGSLPGSYIFDLEAQPTGIRLAGDEIGAMRDALAALT